MGKSEEGGVARPHLRLSYRWSPGLQRFVWFVKFYMESQSSALPMVTSYSDDSAAALRKAREYWPADAYPRILGRGERHA